MTDAYAMSLLVVGGVCVGFGLHAASLAIQTRLRRYGLLVLLALLEAGYCLSAWRYFSVHDARPWGYLFCAFSPVMTCVFGELAMELTDLRPRWLLFVQRLNIALTALFVCGLVVDMLAGTSFCVTPRVPSSAASFYGHRFDFGAFGFAYVGFVSLVVSCFVGVLARAQRSRYDLVPVVAGCIPYGFATMLDLGVSLGFVDGPFIQHFGFFALVVGSWRVLADRFEQALREMRLAVTRLEEQRNQLLLAAPMLHQQKLDSLGTLAAGVAHEINNPIHGIMNYALLLKRQVDDGTLASSFADEIASESKRVAEIVQSLLRFGRAEKTDTVVADFGEILEGTLSLVRSGLVHQGIALEVRSGDALPEISCRAAQLQQVIMNLVTNARDALESRDPSRIDVKCIGVEVYERTVDGEPWLVLDVRDTGDGFDPALAERIFEPFFTTKGEKGTGLGLSVSHGIVQAHGGTITCETSPGRGSLFRVKIPCRMAESPVRSSSGRMLASSP